MKTCELCGTPVEAWGDTTKHYEPIPLKIGAYSLSRRVHGGIWLRKEGGEGGRVIGPNLRVLEDMLEQFWELWF